MNQATTPRPRPRPRSATRPLLYLAAVGLSVTAGACGTESTDGGTAPLLGELSQVEAAELFSALVSAYALVPTPGVPAVGGGGSAYVPVVDVLVDTIQVTQACPAGGTVSVLSHDSIRTVTDARTNPTPDTVYAAVIDLSGRFDITSNYQSCVSTDSNGGRWTFDASPGLNLVFDFTGSTTVASLTSGVSVTRWNWNWDGTWSGTLNWSSGGRSGSCPISVRWTATSGLAADGTATGTTTQTGQVCGLNVSVMS